MCTLQAYCFQPLSLTYVVYVLLLYMNFSKSGPGDYCPSNKTLQCPCLTSFFLVFDCVYIFDCIKYLCIGLFLQSNLLIISANSGLFLLTIQPWYAQLSDSSFLLFGYLCLINNFPIILRQAIEITN